MKLDFDIVCTIWLLIFSLFVAGVLTSIAMSLYRIEYNFKVVQEMQKDITRLQDLTEILEPARPIGGPGGGY